jgi:hypothetical protein
VNWKIPGWAAAAGAVISVAAGLAGGNHFGTILLRAVVSALIAGALGYAAQYVLRRFLPATGSAEAPPAVDILIDEELPLGASPEPAEEAAGQQPGAGLEGIGGLEPAEGAGAAAPTEAEPFANLPEVGELEPAALEGLEAPEPGEPGQPGEALEPAEGTEELPSVEPLEALSAAEAEELPPESAEFGQPSRRELKAEELEAQLDSVTKGQDPASLAKAVRTFLRKDQEG